MLAVYTAAFVPVAIYYCRFPGDLGMAATSFSLTFLFVTMSLLVLLLRAVRSDRERPIAAVAAWWCQWWRDHGPGTIIERLNLPAPMPTFFIGKLIIPPL